MKVSRVFVMLFLVWTALVFFTLSVPKTGSKIQETSFTPKSDDSTAKTANRKLKFQERDTKGESVSLEDYHPIDPVPSSKASVKPGPIEHGSPMIPYVPRPSPPDPTGHGGSG